MNKNGNITATLVTAPTREQRDEIARLEAAGCVLTVGFKTRVEAEPWFVTYCRKGFGNRRKVWNYIVEKAQKEMEENGKWSYDWLKEKKLFNSFKATLYPYLSEVVADAHLESFRDFDKAWKKYWKDRYEKKCKNKRGFPRFKKKKLTAGSFRMNGVATKIEGGKAELGQDPKRHYLWVPVEKKWVELMEALPYEPLQVLNVTVSQKGDHFYVSFNMKVRREDFYNAHAPNDEHRGGLGLDWGVAAKATIASSEGAIKVAPSREEERYEKLLKTRQKNLERKVHARSKEDVRNKVQPSKNYLKAAKKVAAMQRKIAARRIDQERKLVSAIVRCASVIGIEDPNVAGLLRNHNLAKAISNSSPGRLLRLIEWVAEWRGCHVTKADRFFPSTQKCSRCGAVRTEKLGLGDRVFRCEACGAELDRDHNAAATLLRLALAEVESLAPQEEIQRAGEANAIVLYKIETADLGALERRLARDGLKTARTMKEAVKNPRSGS